MSHKVQPWQMVAGSDADLEPIDFKAIKGRVDLRKIVAAYLPDAARFGDFVCCPFHRERTPSMRVYADHFHCYGCDEHGDAFDFLMKLEGLTRPQAAKRIDPSITIADDVNGGATNERTKRTNPPPEPEPAPIAESLGPAWLDPEWQAAVNAIVVEAEQALWSPSGRDALGWLRGRGLNDTVIRRYRLGWNPRRRETPPIGWLSRRDGKPKGITVARGIVIPWLAPFPPRSWSLDDPPDRWVGANVRCLAHPVDAPLPPRSNGHKSPKTLCLNGSTRGYLYPQPEPWPHLRRRPVLIVEGEFDALLGEQIIGGELPVFSVGGASQRTLAREARATLARSPLWLVATDHDAAGVEAARWWKRINPDKARRVVLPWGKDFAEFVAKGGLPHTWLNDIKAKPLHRVSL